MYKAPCINTNFTLYVKGSDKGCVVILVWLTTQQKQSAVAFLPVNPFLTPLRNQGRQKLATLDATDFQQLLIDILTDTKRRQALSLSKSGT